MHGRTRTPPHPLRAALESDLLSDAALARAQRAAKWLPWAIAAVLAASAGGGAARALADGGGVSAGAAVNAPANRMTRVVLKQDITLGASAGESVGGLRLADIADLSGPQAETLGEISISSSFRASGGSMTVSLADVRRALDAAKVHWGQVTLSGSSCTIRRTIEAPVVMPSVNTSRKEDRPAQVVDVSGPATIRSQIALKLCEVFNTEPAKLRLGFDPALNASLDTLVGDRRVDVQTGASNAAARLTVNIAMYEAERVLSEKSITVEVLVERAVVTATAPIARGQAFNRDMLAEGTQWLAPSARTPALIDDLASGTATAAKRIAAGQVITQEDLDSPVVVKRGDIVWVHALSGPITVKAKCRALSQARDGEMVQLRLEGSGQVFSARMSGRGRAVAVVGDTPEQPPTNEPVADGTPVVQPPARPTRPAGIPSARAKNATR